MKNKDKQKTYRERVLEEFDKKFLSRRMKTVSGEKMFDPSPDPEEVKAFISQSLDTTISEVLDEVENMVVDYIGDDAERDAARSRLAEIKKGLK